MLTAISQLLVVQTRLLRSLSGQFLYAGQFFPLLLCTEDLLLDDLRYFGIPVEVVVQLGLQKVKDIRTHRPQARTHIMRTQFGLCLRFKDRFNYFDADRSNDALANVCDIEVLLVKISECFHYGLPEGRLVRPSLSGMLSVYKTVILIVLRFFGVRQCDLDVLSSQMDGLVHGGLINLIGQEILQPILREELLSVEQNGETRIEVHIVPEHALNIFIHKFIVAEYLPVRNKGYLSSFPFTAGLDGCIIGQFPAFEFRLLPLRLRGPIRTTK